MTQQTEAQRLADELEETPDSDGHCRQAAAELRRQEAVNKQLLEALELVMADVKTTPNAYEAQRQAIAAAKGDA
jgi:hypothetical protein